jgi:hypothetical protein
VCAKIYSHFLNTPQQDEIISINETRTMEPLAMKILLMGDPNVGKSVIFSLAGIEVISVNYPGTIEEYTEGRMNLACPWLRSNGCRFYDCTPRLTMCPQWRKPIRIKCVISQQASILNFI